MHIYIYIYIYTSLTVFVLTIPGSQFWDKTTQNRVQDL